MFLRISIRFLTFFLIISLVFNAARSQPTVSDQGESVQPAAAEDESPAALDPSFVDSIPTGPGFTPDVYTPGQARPAKPRFNRLNRWMKVLNEFFSNGNWFSGGPDNLLEYIGRTLTKLLDILMNRDGSFDEAGTVQIFGDNAAQARAAIQTKRSELTVADILKMIPQDRLNIPADRLFN